MIHEIKVYYIAKKNLNICLSKKDIYEPRTYLEKKYRIGFKCSQTFKSNSYFTSVYFMKHLLGYIPVIKIIELSQHMVTAAALQIPFLTYY